MVECSREQIYEFMSVEVCDCTSAAQKIVAAMAGWKAGHKVLTVVQKRVAVRTE